MSFRSGTPAQGVITPVRAALPGSGLPQSAPLDVVAMGGMLVASGAAAVAGTGLIPASSTSLVRVHSIFTTNATPNTFLFDAPLGPTRARALIIAGTAFLALDGLILTGDVSMGNGTATGTFTINYDLVASPQIQ